MVDTSFLMVDLCGTAPQSRMSVRSTQTIMLVYMGHEPIRVNTL